MAIQVELLRVRPAGRPNRVVRADGMNLLAADRDRLGDGEASVDGDDLAVVKHEIRCLPVLRWCGTRAATSADACGEQDGDVPEASLRLSLEHGWFVNEVSQIHLTLPSGTASCSPAMHHIH